MSKKRKLSVFISWLNANVESYLMAILLGSMSLIIFVQVIMRYVFQDSLSWSEEISRYMFIYMIYLGVSCAIHRDRHIRMNFLVNLFSDDKKKIFSVIADVCFLIFTFVMSGNGVLLGMKIINLGQITPSLEIPMGYIYMAAPIGLLLSSIRLVQNLLHKFRNWNADYKTFLTPYRVTDGTASESPPIPEG